ncbi:MAG: hypothetical protein BroJett003_26700 [Planctomycetota bacterium]|nr:MAG: hypothetical protein BroJett003_26700 [Planctomycetota bacterium]
MFNDFALLLSGGMLIVLALGRLDEIAGAYLRLVGLITLALTSLALAWPLLSRAGGNASENTGRLFISGAAALGAVGVILGAAADRKRWVRAGAAFGGCAGISAVCFPLTPSAPTASAGLFAEIISPLHALGIVTQAILLGAVTCAWLLGHAYLTATRMTIAPLQRFGTILLTTHLARTGFVAATLATAFVHARSAAQPLGSEITALDAVVLIMRLGVGILVAGVFTFMTRDCIRRRSTQSATGILYFNSALIYLGELSALHLTRITGTPW